jgi:hypothetical protein
MLNYEETISSLKEFSTMTAHIKKLGKLMNRTEDMQLKKLLEDLIKSLQNTVSNSTKGKSTPTSLYKGTSLEIKKLIQYCESHITVKKPEWQVEAEKAGWAPKT